MDCFVLINVILSSVDIFSDDITGIILKVAILRMNLKYKL